MNRKKHLFLAIVLFVAGIHLVYYAGWTHDDPFITFRYVKNVALGKGLVFNAGEKVEGYSNFLFLLLLIPGIWSGLGLLALSKIYGFFFALGTVLFLLGFLFKYYPDFKPWHILAGLLLAVNGAFALWAVSGMETALSAFFVTGAWALFCRENTEEAKATPWSALLLLGAALNRPEGVIYFIALFCLSLALRKRKKIPTSRLLFWVLLFLVPFGLYQLWRIYYFKNLFPNTFYAKATGGFIPQAKAGFVYIGTFFWQNPYLLLLLVFLPGLLRKKADLPWLSAAILVFSQLIFIIVCGGDWMPLGRFFVPVLAPLVFLFQEALFQTFDKLQNHDPRYRLRDALGLACLILVFLGLVQERRITRPILYSLKTNTLFVPHIQIGKWLGQNLPPGSLIAGEEAGIIPYYSELPFLDLLGIVDPHISRQKGLMHQKMDADYVLSKKPDYVLLYTLNPLNKGKPLKPRIESGRVLLESERFRKLYTPFKSFPHGNELIGRDYITLFVYKNSPLPNGQTGDKNNDM